MAIGMLASTAGLAYGASQNEFWKIIAALLPQFTLYFLVLKYAARQPRSLSFFIAVAILLRVVLVFAEPYLSNDVYRFIWDGRLLVQGYNPFDHLPQYYLDMQPGIPGIDRELFEAFDAKNFYTVYPPLAQLQFGTAVWLFPENEYGAIVVMKLWLLVYEAGTILLLPKVLRAFGLPPARSLIYSLNPLIVHEIVGNLHFEGAMVFFLLLSVWLLQKQKKNLWPALAFAASICSKLLTLMFLPFFLRRMGFRRSLVFYGLTAVFVLLMFIPVVNSEFLLHFGDSLNLYFQKLEYNASLYYLFRWIGFQLTGYNQIAVIGPGLGLLAGGLILWLAFSKKNNSEKIVDAGLMELWLWSICIYLFSTTTLHPWYLALPLLLCVFTRWRFPVVWSFLIMFTYINYSYEPYRENLLVVALEYFTVAATILTELRSERKNFLTL
jgi:hypothetical protein